MDMSKIFLKDACPTPIGGQAVLEGVMMRGTERTAIAVRTPGGDIHVKTQSNANRSRLMKIPVIRGAAAFLNSLVEGTGTLAYSADVLEYYTSDGGDEHAEDDDGTGAGDKRLTAENERMTFTDSIEDRLADKMGTQRLWNFLLFMSVAIAIIFSVAFFVLLPTMAVGWLKTFVHNAIGLNLIEGFLRIAIFLIYITAISRMSDVKRLFQYHGAEHKTIHCFENAMELTPANAQTFYTLHPRCGTSFLMFVMLISLILFSLFGWPNLLWRILSRVILIPVVAGLSYELLKWAGRSDNLIVRILSMPGLYLQKITTNVPDDEQLEVAIISLKAVLVDPEAPYIEGKVDSDGNLVEEVRIEEEKRRRAEEEKEARKNRRGQ